METQTTTTETKTTPVWQEGTRFCHLSTCEVITRRDKNKKQDAAITAAYKITNHGKIYMVEVGFSFCSPTDMKFRNPTPAREANWGVPARPADPGSTGYVKAKGRETAYQRMLTSPTLIAVYSDVEAPKLIRDFIETAVSRRMKIPGLPNSWISLATEKTQED